jgi:hypothetical protein
MSKTRYRAEWTIDLGEQGGGDFNPDVVNYGSKYFRNLREAQLYAYEHDLDGEGRVYTEELVCDNDPGFGDYLDWIETGDDYFIPTDKLSDVERM